MTAPIVFSCTLRVYFMLLSRLLLGYYCTGFLRIVTTSAFSHKIKTTGVVCNPSLTTGGLQELSDQEKGEQTSTAKLSRAPAPPFTLAHFISSQIGFSLVSVSVHSFPYFCALEDSSLIPQTGK